MFDIFLAHRSGDKQFVRQIDKALGGRGYAVFFDERDLREDRTILPQLQSAMDESLVIGLCFGRDGLGPVHQHEMDTALNTYMHEQRSLITIILPGTGEDARPSMYRGFPAIVFDRSGDEETGLARIVRTIDRNREERGLEPLAGKAGAVPGAANAAPVSTPVPDPAVRPEPKRNEELGRALRALRKASREKALNFLVGPLTGIEGRDASNATPGPQEAVPQTHDEFGEPSPYEVAQSLMQAADLRPRGSNEFVLPVETVASWSALRDGGSSGVETELRRLLKARRKSRSNFYQKFAELLKVLASDADSRSEHLRRGHDRRPLVFTTNFGVNLERALIRAGVSFSRIVVKLPAALDVRRFRVQTVGGRIEVLDIHGEPERLVSFDPQREDEDIALQAIEEFARVDLIDNAGTQYSDEIRDTSRTTFDGMEGCILFKYHGSLDVPNSCIVTTEQLFQLTRVSELVPHSVMERLRLNPAVIFGSSLLLGQVQQTVETVLRSAFLANMEIDRFIVPRGTGGLCDRPLDGWFHEFEQSVDPEIRHRLARLSLKCVGGGQLAFVEALLAAIEPANAGR